jgi:vacuolar protein sorting-associated protein 35
LSIDYYNNVLTLLKIVFFAPLVEKFDSVSKKSLAMYICMNILENETVIPTVEQADEVLLLLSPLIKDENETEKIDFEDFAEEQGLIGRYCGYQYEYLRNFVLLLNIVFLISD